MDNVHVQSSAGPSRRSGFMYSIFAIFALSIVVMVVTNPVTIDTTGTQSTASNIDESFYYLSSVEEDLKRAGRITAKRTFSAAVNHVTVNESALAPGTAEDEVTTGFRNGTINGTDQLLLNETSFTDWRSRMITLSSDAGWDLGVTLDTITASSGAPVTGLIDAQFNLTLHHPPSRTRFSRSVTQNYTVSLTNITDPLLLLETDGQYAREFEACPTSARASQLGSGTNKHYDSMDNWTSGRASIRPGNGDVSSISGESDKVLVVDDICAYDNSTLQNEVEDFAGVISETSRPMTDDGDRVCGDKDSSGITAYISGINGITDDLSNGTMTVMTDTDAWSNNIPDEIESGCYFADNEGLHIFDRLEGRLSASGTYTGWSSFVNVPELPPDYQDTSRSAVDHIYFDDTSTNNKKIKGVSDHRTWFKLDQDSIDRWNLNTLAYN